MLHIALHLSRLNCSTSNTQTMLYPSMLTQSSCLVLCLVSLIMLNKPPSRNSPLHLLLLLSCPPHPHYHPSLSQRPVPLLSQSLLQLGSFPSVSELVTLSQPPLTVCCDSTMSPPSLWMMSGCPLEEVTVFFRSLSVFSPSITQTPRDTGLWKERCVKMSGDVTDLLDQHKHKTVCELICAVSH